MDFNTIITSGATTSILAGIAWAGRAIYNSYTENVKYGRVEKDRLEKAIEQVRSDCAAQIKSKDEEIDSLSKALRDIVLKITALLIKFTQIEGYQKIQKEVEELERELKKERYNP